MMGIPQGPWRAFLEALDAFESAPRIDHGIPTDAFALGERIAREPDFPVGSPGLLARLVEQTGYVQAWTAWGPAYAWATDPRRTEPGEG